VGKKKKKGRDKGRKGREKIEKGYLLLSSGSTVEHKHVFLPFMMRINPP
jgi:hypothetical protein